MTQIETISPREAYFALYELTGADPMRGIALAELARSVISSHSICRYQRLIIEVTGLIAPVREVTAEEIRVVVDSLEADGDIVVNQGAVGATPIRAIQLDDRIFKFMSSLPTRRLGSLLPGDWICHESTRLCRASEPARMGRLIAAHGGVLLTAEEWAGLHLEPVADQVWLAAREQQLRDHPHPPESEIYQHRLAWEWLGREGGRLVWRRGESGAAERLWRGINFRGYWIYGLTRGGSPAEQPWLQLRRDDAHRAVFALAAASRAANPAREPIPFSISEEATETIITLPPFLPYAEYRYLTVLASGRQSGQAQVRWSFSRQRALSVGQMLASRLGISLGFSA